jgi:hypothetical protein
MIGRLVLSLFGCILAASAAPIAARGAHSGTKIIEKRITLPQV